MNQAGTPLYLHSRDGLDYFSELNLAGTEPAFDERHTEFVAVNGQYHSRNPTYQMQLGKNTLLTQSNYTPQVLQLKVLRPVRGGVFLHFNGLSDYVLAVYDTSERFQVLIRSPKMQAAIPCSLLPKRDLLSIVSVRYDKMVSLFANGSFLCRFPESASEGKIGLLDGGDSPVGQVFKDILLRSNGKDEQILKNTLRADLGSFK